MAVAVAVAVAVDVAMAVAVDVDVAMAVAAAVALVMVAWRGWNYNGGWMVMSQTTSSSCRPCLQALPIGPI